MADTNMNLHMKLLCEPVLKDQPLVGQGLGSDNTSYENMQSFAEAASSSTESLKDNAAILKEFGDVMPEIIKNLRYMNTVVTQTGQNLPAIRKTITDKDRLDERLAYDRERGLLSVVNTSGNMVQQYASGNIGGMASSLVSGSSNLINAGKDAAKASDNKELFGLLGKVGVAAAIAGAVVSVTDTLANKYIDEMPTIFGTGRSFGYLDNDEYAMASYNTINGYNKGTNLSTQEFSGVIQSLRKQGIGNGLSPDEQMALAGSIAQTTSRWAYATGGDADQYAGLAGLMARYGGSLNVAEDFNRIVTSGYASGLETTQIPEFLSGIQKVMEDGIAKGFTRSATEVADTLLMFSKMSGNNAFWQGEQGAKLLNQVNSGISNATSLSKTEDILVYGAFANAYKNKDISKILDGTYIENGGYINTMQLIEQGINGDNFGSIMDSLDSAYGNNTQAKVEALRKMTGLNYTGAARLLNLDRNATNSEIQSVMETPENLNNETQYQEAMNEIKQHVIAMGQGVAEMKIQGMDLVVSGMDKICSFLGLGDTDSVFDSQPLSNNLLWGESAEGAWGLDDNFNWEYSKKDFEKNGTRAKGYQTFKNYLGHRGDMGFGDFIINDLGAGYQANDFIKFLYSDEKAASLRDYVGQSTVSGMITVEEQTKTQEILREMYDLWKQTLGDKLIVYESE